MASVYGTIKTKVDIDTYQLFEGLCNELEVPMVCETLCGEYYKVEEDVLRHYRDTSYHGSPYYECIGEIKDKKIVKAYRLMSELKELIKAN